MNKDANQIARGIAEKIADIIWELPGGVDRNIYSEDILKAIVPEIASHLDEAAKEAEQRGRESEGSFRCKCCFQDGYAAAREQAAGICESLHLSTIAKVMRAMTPGGK